MSAVRLRVPARHRPPAGGRGPSGPVDIGLTEPGYLYLAAPNAVDAMRANHAIQRGGGRGRRAARRPTQLTDRFPWLSTDGDGARLARAHGRGLVRRLRAGPGVPRKAARAAARAVTRPRRRRSAVADDRIVAVDSLDGTSLADAAVVDAAGPWAAGSPPWPASTCRSRRDGARCSSSSPRTRRDCPLVIDPSGAWFRPEGGAVHRAPSRRTRRRRRRPAARAGHAAVRGARSGRRSRTACRHSMRVRVTNAWAGYYEMNTFDHNAMIGPHPDVPNLIVRERLLRPRHPARPGRRARHRRADRARAVRDAGLSIFGFERIAAGRRGDRAQRHRLKAVRRGGTTHRCLMPFGRICL